LILALFHRNLYANSQQIIYTSTILPDCHLPPRVALVAVDKGEQLKRRQARHGDNDRLEMPDMLACAFGCVGDDSK
jgi:hypothetical protein